jgi:hypothetical protein
MPARGLPLASVTLPVSLNRSPGSSKGASSATLGDSSGRPSSAASQSSQGKPTTGGAAGCDAVDADVTATNRIGEKIRRMELLSWVDEKEGAPTASVSRRDAVNGRSLAPL